MNGAAAAGGGGRGRSTTRRKSSNRSTTRKRSVSSSNAAGLVRLPRALSEFYGGIHVFDSGPLHDWLQTQANLGDLVLYCSGEIMEDYFEDEVGGNPLAAIAVDAKGRVTAIASMEQAATALTLNVLCVGKKGAGGGKAMTAAIIEFARGRGIKTIFLSPTDNAVAFYSKLGFKSDDDNETMKLEL